MRAWLLGLALVCACGGPAEPSESATGATRGAAGASIETAGSGGASASLDDLDGDGLCDATELHVGSDPERADTDGDGLPDLIEAVYDLDPFDPSAPTASRLALLPAEAGASLDFEVRVTVSGTGQWHSGSFDAGRGLYDDGTAAYDFYEGAFASSADPADNVRGIDRDAQRFSSVVGDTRLSFVLRFRHPVDPPTCVRAYPFRYTVKTAVDDILADEEFLLVTVPPDASLEAGPWCTLGACL